MNIGENIKKFRKEKGYDQKKLAELLNVSNRTVSSWEIGRTEPNMGMVENIASVLEINKTDLINGYRTIEFEHIRESDTLNRLLAYCKLLNPEAQNDLLKYAKYLNEQKDEET